MLLYMGAIKKSSVNYEHRTHVVLPGMSVI